MVHSTERHSCVKLSGRRGVLKISGTIHKLKWISSRVATEMQDWRSSVGMKDTEGDVGKPRGGISSMVKRDINCQKGEKPD
jgi:hypothetical protein